MHVLIAIIITFCILSIVILLRKKHIINKLKRMGFCEKLLLFNELAGKFGFCYIPDQDIIVSRLDAWQKNFGYCTLYDNSACHFNMVFHCEPVYFNYNNCTWLIEFWKGQYGINVGAEIGIYKADTIIPPNQYETTIFCEIAEEEMLPLSMNLNWKGTPLFHTQKTHWWLTGFQMGNYCRPEDTTLEASITFPNTDMLDCFVKSLERLGYSDCQLHICDLTVSLCFSVPHTSQPQTYHRFSCKISMWQNQLFCKLYHYITRPFSCTLDKILYLYFFLPASFRHMLRFKRNRKQKRNKCNKELLKPSCSRNFSKRKEKI